MKTLLKDYKTTIAGVVILACTAMLFFKILSASEYISILGGLTAAGFYFAKDKDDTASPKL